MEHASSPGTFLLGLGAAKSGTTWLNAYLRSYAEADMGRCGEYQIWDALHVPAFAHHRVPPPSARTRLEARVAALLGLPVKARVLRHRMQADPEAYFAYFERLLARPGIRLTGDISPSYAALPAPVLATIAEGFRARGIRPRAVFLMRDPVERCWSTLRMKKRKGQQPAAAGDEALLLGGFYRSEGMALLTRYDRTIAAARTVFPPEDLHLALYEELFSEDGLAALGRFLGLPPRPERAETRVNATPKGGALSPAARRQIACHYAEVYRFCAAEFPRIRTLWPSAADVLGEDGQD